MLLPVVVVVAGAIGFLVVLWTRVAWESVRAHRHALSLPSGGVGSVRPRAYRRLSMLEADVDDPPVRSAAVPRRWRASSG